MIYRVPDALRTELRTVLRAHERALGLTICVRPLDPRWRDRLHPLLPERLTLHYSPFCVAAKRADTPACKHDCSRVCAGACQDRSGPFQRRCYADANELIVPMAMDGGFIGMCHVGPFRTTPQQPAELPLWSGPRVAAALALLCSLQAWLHDFLDRLRLADSVLADDDASRIETFLDTHLAQDPRLADLARELRSSPSWAATLVRRALGCSFRAAKEQRRLATACRLLELSDCTVAVVARRVGMSDPDYFCRYFRTKLGCTPSEWRRRHARTPAV